LGDAAPRGESGADLPPANAAFLTLSVRATVFSVRYEYLTDVLTLMSLPPPFLDLFAYVCKGVWLGLKGRATQLKNTITVKMET
jgi:hypothetical protein